MTDSMQQRQHYENELRDLEFKLKEARRDIESQKQYCAMRDAELAALRSQLEEQRKRLDATEPNH